MIWFIVSLVIITQLWYGISMVTISHIVYEQWHTLMVTFLPLSTGYPGTSRSMATHTHRCHQTYTLSLHTLTWISCKNGGHHTTKNLWVVAMFPSPMSKFGYDSFNFQIPTAQFGRRPRAGEWSKRRSHSCWEPDRSFTSNILYHSVCCRYKTFATFTTL